MEWIIIVLLLAISVTLFELIKTLNRMERIQKSYFIESINLLMLVKQNTGEFLDKDTSCRHNHGKYK